MVAVAQSGQWAVQLTPGQSSRRFGLSDPTDVGSRAELDGQSGLARRAVGRGFPTDGRTVASRQRTVELVRRADAWRQSGCRERQPDCRRGQSGPPSAAAPAAHGLSVGDAWAARLTPATVGAARAGSRADARAVGRPDGQSGRPDRLTDGQSGPARWTVGPPRMDSRAVGDGQSARQSS